MKIDPGIQIGIRGGLEGENDIAAHGSPADVFGAAVRRLHDPRAAAGHDRHSGLSQATPDLPSQAVVGVVFLEAGGTENRDAGTYEMQSPEPLEAFTENAKGSPQILQPAVRPLEKPALLHTSLVPSTRGPVFSFKGS